MSQISESDSKVEPVACMALRRVRVVMSHTSHPGNIGAAARAMKTMGLSQLVLVNPRLFKVDGQLHTDAVAMAAGADDVLNEARVVSSLEEALQGTTLVAAMTARRRDLMAPMQWPRDAAPMLLAEVNQAAQSMAEQGEVAIVFGNETSGLSNEELARCQIPVMIPAQTGFSSLNVAAAVQVMCYELRVASLQRNAAPPQTVLERAPHDDVERLMEHFERAMVGSGFLDPASPKRLMLRLRRLFARTALEREEVNILRGMLDAFEFPNKGKKS